MRIVVIYLMILGCFLSQAFANTEIGSLTYGDKISKDLFGKNTVDVSKVNNLLLSKELKKGTLRYNMKTCMIPIKGKKLSWKKKKIISSISLNGISNKLKVTINGLRIEGTTLSFHTDSRCEKLYPIKFTSSVNQLFRGVKIKKGDEISDLDTYEKPYATDVYGVIGKHGYLLEKNESNGRNKNEIQKCLGIKRKGKFSRGVNRGPNKGFTHFLYSNKVFTHEDMYGDDGSFGWPSRYFGNVLCTSNPKAKIACASVVSNFEGVVSSWRELNLPNAIKSGKRCDKAIADFERRTGKKVPVSPFIPKSKIKSVLKKGYPYTADEF